MSNAKWHMPLKIPYFFRNPSLRQIPLNKAELRKGERRSGGGGAVASRSFDLLNLDLDDRLL